jgi:hypothetical protein
MGYSIDILLTIWTELAVSFDGLTQIYCIFRITNLNQYRNSTRVGLSHLREVGWGGMDWINLAQDRDRWRASVSAVMNLRVQ